jgi:hypothetical protein
LIISLDSFIKFILLNITDLPPTFKPFVYRHIGSIAGFKGFIRHIAYIPLIIETRDSIIAIEPDCLYDRFKAYVPLTMDVRNPIESINLNIITERKNMLQNIFPNKKLIHIWFNIGEYYSRGVRYNPIYNTNVINNEMNGIMENSNYIERTTELCRIIKHYLFNEIIDIYKYIPLFHDE